MLHRQLERDPKLSIPAADAERSTLTPTLNSTQKTSRTTELKCPVADGADQEVQIVLNHVSESLKHDIHAESSTKAWRDPVKHSLRWVILKVMLNDEDPNPHQRESAC